jgi:hypothetical protein
MRASGAVRLLGVALYIAGLVMLRFYLPFRIADHHRVWILPLFCLCGALWLLDLFMTRIVLSDQSIRIVSILDFVSRTVPRVNVDSVTWEKGCGASIRLRDGQWVRLPNVGRNAQGLTNTIRAWLKRTAGTS